MAAERRLGMRVCCRSFSERSQTHRRLSRRSRDSLNDEDVRVRVAQSLQAVTKVIIHSPVTTNSSASRATFSLLSAKLSSKATREITHSHASAPNEGTRSRYTATQNEEENERNEKKKEKNIQQQRLQSIARSLNLHETGERIEQHLRSLVHSL